MKTYIKIILIFFCYLRTSLIFGQEKKIDTTYYGFKVAYYANKNLKSKIEFKKGKANGLAQMYNENGKLSETGTFINNRWVGNYQLFYDNGQVAHSFNFDKEGRRIGFQRYFHKNGILAIIGNFYNGKEDGYILEFNNNGQLINSRLFNNGVEQPKDTVFQKKYVELFESMLDFVKKENEVVLKVRKLKSTEEELALKQKEILISELQGQKKQQEIEALNKDKSLKELELKNVQLETNKQKEEAKIKNEQLKQEQQQRWFLYGGLSLVIVFSGFVFNRLKITQRQNNIIASQKKEVETQKHSIQEKQKEITDSINYAQRLQQAILPPTEFITKNFPDNFILYKPKDIVAGDFYWAEQINDLFFIAAADCTGHGVPGAMVSVVCSNALNRTVKEFALTDTGKILDKTRELVIETFEKSNAEIKDGMDISLLCIDKKNQKLYWSGAHNALWYIQDNILTEIKADKQPVGKSYDAKPFTTNSIDYKTDTTFYLFTDGFADQFGGPKGKKFKYKQFEETLVAINQKSMTEQSNIIDKKFNEWKGSLEQVDDVCVIGIKI